MSKDDKQDDKALTEDDPTAGNKAVWKAFSVAAGMGAGLAATQATRILWRGVTGKKTPINPSDPVISWPEAIAWAAVSGALAELARVVANRAATQYWVNSTGGLPPDMKPPEDEKKD